MTKTMDPMRIHIIIQSIRIKMDSWSNLFQNWKSSFFEYCSIEICLRIELALIKGKQDTLRDAQPLSRFPPIQTSTQSNEIQETPQLPPKDLIEQYELTKSQLAFTYCSQNSDDTATVHWKSTIYSATMTG